MWADLLRSARLRGAAPLAQRQVRPEGGDAARGVAAQVCALRERLQQRGLQRQQL